MSYLSRETSKKEQNAFTNLDQDLKSSRTQKYKERENEVKEYIFQILSIPNEIRDEYKKRNYDLMDILQDGELFCKLGNLVGVAENPCSKYRSSKMPFVQMENISFFLQLCNNIGVPHDEIFQTVDIFDRKDPYQVIVTMVSFSRVVNKINPKNFPFIIGPKVAKIKPTVPKKPISLRNS